MALIKLHISVGNIVLQINNSEIFNHKGRAPHMYLKEEEIKRSWENKCAKFNENLQLPLLF